MTTRTPRVTTVLMSSRTRTLKRQLTLAVEGDDRGVHQGRVATRRLREAVPVLTKGVRSAKSKKVVSPAISIISLRSARP